MIRRILIACSLLTIMGCAPDMQATNDDGGIATAQSALIADWQSDLTGQTPVPEPWLCSPNSYNPLTQAWPTSGWCQPMPSTTAGVPHPWRVTDCTANYPANVPATIKIYTGVNRTGACARLWGDNTFNGYFFNTDLVRVNGWHNDTGTVTRIMSVAIDPQTEVCLCAGPMGGINTCQAEMTCGSTGPGMGATVWNSLPHPDGSMGFMDVAAIRVGHGLDN